MNFFTGFIVGVIVGVLLACVVGWTIGRWLAQEEEPESKAPDHKIHRL